MYYFHDGKVIREKRSVDEPETTVRDSDAEELLSEAMEYAAIFAARP